MDVLEADDVADEDPADLGEPACVESRSSTANITRR